VEGIPHEGAKPSGNHPVALVNLAPADTTRPWGQLAAAL